MATNVQHELGPNIHDGLFDDNYDADNLAKSALNLCTRPVGGAMGNYLPLAPNSRGRSKYEPPATAHV